MRGRLLAAVGLAAIACGGVAHAQSPAVPPPTTVAPAGPSQSLREALVQTYETNPTIMAQRQSLRGTDENAALARAAGRPSVSATADFDQDVVTRNFQAGNGRQLAVGASISAPIYSGGRVRNGIRAADMRVDAGRADLRATEGDIFTEAVAAYMDVIRDRAIVELNRNQVRVLDTNLQATRDRFEVGDLTRTDVAQSEARLALARSSLALAEGRLEASEENYRRVIGQLPLDLQPPPPLPTLPADPDLATEVGLANNADLAAIASRARAAGYDVSVARGGRLPTISIGSGTRYVNSLGTADEVAGLPNGTLPNSTTATSVGLSLTVPLYQGGAGAARVRQAQAFRSQLQEQAIGVERLIVSNTRAAYAQYVAANEAIESNTIAVAANELALEGTRAEQTVGTRNILDVLNAEQELLNSQVLLVTARRDAYVAGFQLLNAMGMAEAEDLNLDGGALYDPTINYERYVHDWSDWNDGPGPRPVATRTVPADANSPLTPIMNNPVTERRQ
jgi:outer membrane protein